MLGRISSASERQEIHDADGYAMRRLGDLCCVAYLDFLENECAAYLTLLRIKSPLFATAKAGHFFNLILSVRHSNSAAKF